MGKVSMAVRSAAMSHIELPTTILGRCDHVLLLYRVHTFREVVPENLFLRPSPIRVSRVVRQSKLFTSSKPIFMAWIRFPSLYKDYSTVIRTICFSTEWLKIVVKKEWNKSKICTRWNVTFYSNWTSWNWSAKRYIYVFLLAAISRERWIRIDSRLVLLVR